VGLLQLGEEFVCAPRSLRIFLHDLSEEIRDLSMTSVFRIPDVLAIIMTSLEGVVLQGDQIKNHVTEARLSGSHTSLLGIAPATVYPRLLARNAGRCVNAAVRVVCW
jgi:hypothetical protein